MSSSGRHRHVTDARGTSFFLFKSALTGAIVLSDDEMRKVVAIERPAAMRVDCQHLIPARSPAALSDQIEPTPEVRESTAACGGSLRWRRKIADARKSWPRSPG